MIQNVNDDDVLIFGLQDIFSKQSSSPTRPLTLLSFSNSIHLSYYLTPFQLCTTSAKKTKAGFFNKPYNRRVQKIKTLSHERPKKPAPAIMCTVKRCPCSSSERPTGQPKWRQIQTVFESFLKILTLNPIYDIIPKFIILHRQHLNKRIVSE